MQNRQHTHFMNLKITHSKSEIPDGGRLKGCSPSLAQIYTYSSEGQDNSVHIKLLTRNQTQSHKLKAWH